MARLVDWRCLCGHVEHDALADVDASRSCPECGLGMEQDWLPRTRRNAQWDDRTAVLVHVNTDPNCPPDVRVRYPGSHDAQLKPGYERVYLRSLREVERFEREHKVMNHVMHYDRNGRGIDDTIFGEKATH